MRTENQYQETSFEFTASQAREYLRHFASLKKTKYIDFPCCGVRENISTQNNIETCQYCGQSFYIVQ